MHSTILTIGHSNHAINTFLSILKSNGVETICDVRSSPYSRMHPQFNRPNLAEDLKRNSIGYVFLGKELGARSDDPKCYKDNKVQYSLLAETTLFQAGIHRLETGCKKFRIALMCAEREPLDCHRTILVARYLVGRGYQIDHILADGRIETQQTTLARLKAQLKLENGDLFMADEELDDAAYRQQAERIAYVRPVENSSTAKQRSTAEE